MQFVKCVCLKAFLLNLLFSLPALTQERPEEVTITASPLDLFTDRSADKLEWEQSTAPSIQEYLREQSAIQARTNGSPTLSIRGSLAADRTLTLFGLAPLQAGDGSGPAYPLLGEEFFDTLYVYKGPSSLHFGSKATGGAFRFLPQRREKNRLQIFAGSFDQYSYSLQLNALKMKDHHLQVTFFEEAFHNSYDHKSGPNYTSGRWKPNHSDWKRASATYFYKNSYTSVLFGEKIGKTPAAGGADINSYDQESYLVSHYNELQLHTNHSLRWQFSYLETDYDNLQSGNTSNFLNKNTNAVLQMESKVTDYLINLIQLQYNHHDTSSDSFGTFSQNRNDEFDVGLQQVYNVKGILIEPQMRYLTTYEKWIKGLTLSQNKYYISYTEGFRAPQPYALYQDNAWSMSNPNLQPEQSKQLEVGHKHESYQVKVYHINYTDMFNTIEHPGPKWQTINEEKAKSTGLEIELKHKSTFYDLHFSTNYMRSEGSGGQALPLSPRLQTNLSFSYYYGFLQIQPQIRSWYKYYLTAFSPVKHEERADNWTTFDLHIHTFGFSKWQLSLGVNNVFSEQRSFDRSYPEPLRTYFARYRLYF